MKTANEIQIEALAMAYDSLRLRTEDMTQDKYELDTEREWVGITDEDYEVGEIYSDKFLEGVDWAEAKLREKNT